MIRRPEDHVLPRLDHVAGVRGHDRVVWIACGFVGFVVTALLAADDRPLFRPGLLRLNAPLSGFGFWLGKRAPL